VRYIITSPQSTAHNFQKLKMSKAKNWCFTTNNYNDQHLLRISAIAEDDSTAYLCYGKEVGAEGTPHLQGYVSFKARKRFEQVKRLIPDSHLSVARGTASQNQAYCQKEGDFTEFGDPPSGAGERCDLKLFMEAVKSGCTDRKLLREEHSKTMARYPRFCSEYIGDHEEADVPDHPLFEWQRILNEKLSRETNDREIVFVVDKEGNVGKTWFAKWFCARNETAQYMESTKKADMAYSLKRDVTHLFVNCTRQQVDFLNYSFLEAVKDGMVFSGKYESCTKIVGPCHVIVMMNQDPEMDKLSSDRYKIIIP